MPVLSTPDYGHKPWLDAGAGRLARARARMAGLKNSFADEDHLQQTVQRILIEAGVEHTREASLSMRDRIDFLAIEDGRRIGIECKIRPGGMAVWRQLSRYAERLDGLILITTAPLDRTLVLYKPDGTQLPLTLIELWRNF